MNPQARLDYAHQTPALFKKLAELSKTIADSEHLDAGLAHLVDIRASQINGCAFCLDMHAKEARLHGERELRLHHVAAWHDSPLFTPRERVALEWTEAVTRMAPGGVPDALYDEARRHFSEPELSALTFRVASINAWNRLCVTFRTVPGSRDKALGLDKAGLV